MLRLLPALVGLALLVFCLIECVQTDSSAVRNLEKNYWLLLIVIVPIAGPLAWLVAGRPARRPASYRSHGQARGRVKGPDDDPDFLANLSHPGAPTSDEQRSDRQRLEKWEEDLRRREEQLRGEDGSSERPDAGDDPRA